MTWLTSACTIIMVFQRGKKFLIFSFFNSKVQCCCFRLPYPGFALATWLQGLFYFAVSWRYQFSFNLSNNKNARTCFRNKIPLRTNDGFRVDAGFGFLTTWLQVPAVLRIAPSPAGRNRQKSDLFKNSLACGHQDHWIKLQIPTPSVCYPRSVWFFFMNYP